MVINKGEVIQTGTYEELLIWGSLHKNHYEMQFKTAK